MNRFSHPHHTGIVAAMAAADGRGGLPAGRTGLAALMVLVLFTAACSLMSPHALFGQNRMQETYADQTEGPSFDHSRFDALLKEHVDERGGIDYASFKEDADELAAYIQAVAEAPYDKLPREEAGPADQRLQRLHHPAHPRLLG